ncbi:MFS transporter [Ectobacillus sp. JY-23]|uniref:MDR family MFS transporter n=1 Tax=Ectobacillus sp. JY-23 TaxID=2933872 RepID=UPI001FF36B96|nr:MFS transporter [Ectobacillus sp. JY-23]UOY91114.1 MFS transporter [Ectobacillus sp. JY-23]
MFLQLHRNIQIRILTSFLSRAVGSMVFPFMAIYFTETMSATWAGLLLLINVVASLLMGFYGGYIADRIGRKRVMIWGQTATILSFACMALANSPWWESPWLTFFMMLVNSLAAGLINPAAEAMLIDVSTKETRAFMYSVNYWAVNLSIMLGALVGGWFFKTHRFELFLTLTMIAAVTLFIMAIWMTEVYQPKKRTEKVTVWKDITLSYRVVMKNRTFLIFSLASIFVLALEFQRNNYIAVRLSEEFPAYTAGLFGYEWKMDGIRMLSFLTMENTFLIVACTVLVARWMQSRPELPLLYLGTFLQAVGFGVMAFHNHIAVLLLACLVQTIGEMLYVPVRQSKMADIIEDEARGAYMAINGLVFQAAKIIGALGIILGNLIGGFGMALGYLVLGIASILLFKHVLEQKKAMQLTQRKA